MARGRHKLLLCVASHFKHCIVAVLNGVLGINNNDPFSNRLKNVIVEALLSDVIL